MAFPPESAALVLRHFDLRGPRKTRFPSSVAVSVTRALAQRAGEEFEVPLLPAPECGGLELRLVAPGRLSIVLPR